MSAKPKTSSRRWKSKRVRHASEFLGAGTIVACKIRGLSLKRAVKRAGDGINHAASIQEQLEGSIKTLTVLNSDQCPHCSCGRCHNIGAEVRDVDAEINLACCSLRAGDPKIRD